MKKFLLVLLSFVVASFLLVACGKEDEKPSYDWLYNSSSSSSSSSSDSSSSDSSSSDSSSSDSSSSDSSSSDDEEDKWTDWVPLSLLDMVDKQLVVSV